VWLVLCCVQLKKKLTHFLIPRLNLGGFPISCSKGLRDKATTPKRYPPSRDTRGECSPSASIPSLLMFSSPPPWTSPSVSGMSPHPKKRYEELKNTYTHHTTPHHTTTQYNMTQLGLVQQNTTTQHNSTQHDITTTQPNTTQLSRQHNTYSPKTTLKNRWCSRKVVSMVTPS